MTEPFLAYDDLFPRHLVFAALQQRQQVEAAVESAVRLVLALDLKVRRLN